jgi:hypothetical protein
MNTETIIRRIKENKVVAIGTAVVILIIIVLLIKSYGVKGPVPNEGSITVTGSFACLPYQDDAPQPRDCTLGVKDNGNYYAIDISTISLAVTDLKADDKIVVSGNFVPSELITSQEWKKYKVAGLINVESLTRGR